MNERIIWDFLYDKIKNQYGVAGLMGNLFVESRLTPNRLQNTYKKKLGMTDDEYTSAVDNGSYVNFVRDSAGYGLVQWTYWSRKEELLKYAKKVNKSIGNLEMQLEFLWLELQKYKTCLNVLKTATNVKEASDIVCTSYERPADQSEKGKQNRANYGNMYYLMFATKETSCHKSVFITTDKVNIRKGNGKEYDRITMANAASSFEYVATSQNNWHAIKLRDQVAWVSGEFSKVR